MNTLEPNQFIRQCLLEAPETTKYNVGRIKKAAEKILDQIEPNSYYHSTNSLFDKPKPYYDQTVSKSSDKPKGFWSAKGNEWVDWSISEMPQWLTKYIYKLNVDILDPSILKFRDIDSFEPYLKEMKGLDHPLLKPSDFYFYWNPLSKHYKGIEVDNPRRIAYTDMKQLSFLLGWDISSLVLWDTSVLKGYDLAFEYNDELGIYEKK